MSLINDLLKTPAEVREEELLKLQQMGQIQSQNLAQMQGRYSGAPGIFGKAFANLQAQQGELANKTARRMSEAVGQAGRAAGQAGLISPEQGRAIQETGRTALMSQEERQAEQAQQIMQGVSQATDKVAAYKQAAEKAFAAGNQKLGLALETKAGELAAAQAKAQREERELQVKEGEYKLEANEIGNVLGVDTANATVSSMATARQILEAGKQPDGTYSDRAKQNALAVLRDKEGNKVNVTNIGPKAESSFAQQLGKNNATALSTSLEQIDVVNRSLNNIAQGKELLNEGIITGFGAQVRVDALRAGKLFGMTDATTDELVERTEQFQTVMAKEVLSILGSGELGAGTGLSDKDREFAEKVANGNIDLDANSLKELIRISEQANVYRVKQHNNLVARLKQQYPESTQNIGYSAYEGATATDPETGAKLIYRGGEWQPLNPQQ